MPFSAHQNHNPHSKKASFVDSFDFLDFFLEMSRSFPIDSIVSTSGIKVGVGGVISSPLKISKPSEGGLLRLTDPSVSDLTSPWIESSDASSESVYSCLSESWLDWGSD